LGLKGLVVVVVVVVISSTNHKNGKEDKFYIWFSSILHDILE
jgi:hypothetical protein